MKKIAELNGFTIESDLDIRVSLQETEPQKDVTEYAFCFEWNGEDAKANPDAGIHFYRDDVMADILYMWRPCCGTNRVLDGNWKQHHDSKLTHSAPVTVLYNGRDESRLCAACSEVLKKISFRVGTQDYVNTIHIECGFELFQFGVQTREEMTVRLDRRNQRYEDALKAVVAWWDEKLSIRPYPVPAVARLPLYSSWYAFHQVVRQDIIEAECEEAARMGMKAIIMDDGWQTSQNWSGYRYTGDWEFAPDKFPDFKAHVQKIHSLGMKYILWFSVPMIGWGSKAWESMKDMCLYENKGCFCGILDPRYPQVRSFLIELYERFVREYDLDGFKLDFVDSFDLRDKSKQNVLDPRMDYICVQEATDRLMTDIANHLLALKPDMLLEFRQSYIGPKMRQYGNMFRVGDCSLDLLSNRIGVVDIRLLAGDRAVHGDMLTWNEVESPETGVLQVLAVIFGVIQLSKILTQSSPEQKRAAEFWIRFAAENERVLQESGFIAEAPQLLYPIIRAFDEKEEIIGVYANNTLVKLPEDKQKVQLINAKQEEYLLISLEKAHKLHLLVRNTYGETVQEQDLELSAGMHQLACPVSGLVELDF